MALTVRCPDRRKNPQGEVNWHRSLTHYDRDRIHVTAEPLRKLLIDTSD
jgi:hypothetical protein